MKRFLVILGLLSIAACTRSSDVILADGSAGKAVKCPGLVLDMSDCYRRASEECPRGYQVVTGDESYYGNFNYAYLGGTYAFPAATAYSMPIVRRNILVKCN